MRSYFAIVETDAEQPWLARLYADNGVEGWRTSENYADVRDAERTVCIAAEAMYRGRAHLEDVPPVRPDERREGRIVLQLDAGTARLSVPVLYLDERIHCRVCGCTVFTPCDPPCAWEESDLCSNPGCLALVGAISFGGT